MYILSQRTFSQVVHIWHCLPLIPIPCGTSAGREAAVLKQSWSSNYNYSCQHCAMTCDAYFGVREQINHDTFRGIREHAFSGKFENNYGLLK